ncbi:MAG: 50S ribosomal protein L15 [Candidatus Chaera renei]|uniref:Large ribosomal subunit protein uL15 n=1 Tax=Candidatus Chaera renei TaxID=2506947 RepID=A0A4Q0AJL1_9BACT|nr:MAG: 50S ribosomal protein L15 [Candidatus Chaera renei]
MKYHQLTATSKQQPKRAGRGIAAGRGKTAGRGTKGQNARAGSRTRATFMGGQGPLMQRVPKLKGFKSLKAPAQVVYLDQLNRVKGATLDNFRLFEAGLIATPYHAVKIIARGEYTGKAAVQVQAASASVKAAIAKAGGSFEAVSVPIKPAAKPSASAGKKSASV